MSIAITLKSFLDSSGVEYELIPHPYSRNSIESAHQAHVPPEKLAKSVILEDEGGYLMAVCPASKKIRLGDLYHETNRKLEFANESELADMLGDCVLGAVPPVGELYDIDVIVDTELFMQDDVYFEAGDHVDLIHVSADAFERLMQNAEHGSFAKRA